MNWSINHKIWEDEESNIEISFVLNDIAQKFEKLIPNGPVLGYKEIKVLNDPIDGPRVYWPLPEDHYKIGLNIDGICYNKVAYQFAKEICHLYTDPRTNNWFIETLCNLSSLYFLELIQEQWKENSPNDNLKNYHKFFGTFKKNIISRVFSKVDMVQYQISDTWIKDEILKLVEQKPPLDKEILVLAAVEILPLFKKYPKCWKILPYISSACDPSPSTNKNDLTTIRNSQIDFKKLIDLVPEDLKELVETIKNKLLY